MEKKSEAAAPQAQETQATLGPVKVAEPEVFTEVKQGKKKGKAKHAAG